MDSVEYVSPDCEGKRFFLIHNEVIIPTPAASRADQEQESRYDNGEYQSRAR